MIADLFLNDMSAAVKIEMRLSRHPLLLKWEQEMTLSVISFMLRPKHTYE